MTYADLGTGGFGVVDEEAGRVFIAAVEVFEVQAMLAKRIAVRARCSR